MINVVKPIDEITVKILIASNIHLYITCRCCTLEHERVGTSTHSDELDAVVNSILNKFNIARKQAIRESHQKTFKAFKLSCLVKHMVLAASKQANSQPVRTRHLK